ncbi:MAG TPA: SDR family oxidoreductase [Chitinophagaceae bacterium]|jgi:NAD(P)-dependent dehydrogenase (short-subunit alcohol dehydrogenase family)
MKKKAKKLPEQKQHLPGSEQKMHPRPVFNDPAYVASGRLKNKVALITGGDSGIGRAVAVLFAREGARLAISYLNEQEDARETKRVAEEYGAQVLLIPGDISKEKNCIALVSKTIRQFGKIDILVNNAGEQHNAKTLEELESKNLVHTFQVNVFAMFYITREALKHMIKGSCIINTASITAYKGSPELLDYSATKGAIVAFTRSLSTSLVPKGIRVNGVAPGPIWTPLIPATFNRKKTSKHGSNAPMDRPGQPVEVAPAYLFLASEAATYMTGQMLHPNGGTVVNS